MNILLLIICVLFLCLIEEFISFYLWNKDYKKDWNNPKYVFPKFDNVDKYSLEELKELNKKAHESNTYHEKIINKWKPIYISFYMFHRAKLEE